MDRIAFSLMLFCIVWAPLPFASQRPWAAALLCVLWCFVILCCLLARLRSASNTYSSVLSSVKLPLYCLLAIQLWVFIQILPLPFYVIELLSPQTAKFHIERAWVPISLDVYSTKLYLIKGIGFSCAFLATILLVNSKKRLQLVTYTIIGSGLLQATYGSMMVLSGLEYGFFVEKYVGRGAATGTFVNSNHFAGYMVLCLSLAIGHIIAYGEQRGRVHSNRSRILGGLDYLISVNGLLRIAVAVMIVALMLSHSRSANIFFIVALCSSVAVSMLYAKKLDVKLALLFVGFILIDIVVVGQWFGFREVAQRLAETQFQSEDRGSIALMVFHMAKEFPLTGIGGGAFDMVFPAFKDANFDLRYQHAHNDYLEISAELGLLGFACFLSLVLSTMLVLFTRVLRRSSRAYRAVAYAGVMAGCWLSLHSLTDFNLQISANAMTVIIIFGLIWRAAYLDSNEN